MEAESERIPRGDVKDDDNLFEDWEDWSSWIEIIVPDERKEYLQENSGEELYWKRRDGEGWKMVSKVFKRNFEQGNKGIYELGTVMYEGGEMQSSGREVVYIGKAGAKDDYPLFTRIKYYMRNGSHKKDEINAAVKNGYSVEVRFLLREDPTGAESSALNKYQYPWNLNGSKSKEEEKKEEEGNKADKKRKDKNEGEDGKEEEGNEPREE